MERIVNNRFLKNNEILDDLQFDNLRILQKKDGFKFGIDALLLSKFIEFKKKDKVIDLGTGTGIIPIILTGIYGLKNVYALEIQEELVDMAKRSVKLNSLQENIEIIHGDIRSVKKYFKAGAYEVVVSNPPYMVKDSGFINDKDSKTISRHEVLCNLNDVINAANHLLKFGGNFFLVHKPERLVDIFTKMREKKIEPKKLVFVSGKKGDKPNLVLIKGTKGGKIQLNIEKPVYLYNNNGNQVWNIIKSDKMKGEK